MIQSPMQPLLSERDLSELIGRSVSTIQKDRLSGGGIPFIRIGRLVRYRTADVEKWLELHCRRSTSDVGGNHALAR